MSIGATAAGGHSAPPPVSAGRLGQTARLRYRSQEVISVLAALVVTPVVVLAVAALVFRFLWKLFGELLNAGFEH